MAARFLDMALDDVAKSRAANNRSPASRRGGLRGAGGAGGAGAGSGRDSPNRSNRSSPYSVSFYRKKSDVGVLMICVRCSNSLQSDA